MDDAQAAAIRRQVLLGLARDRRPGWSFTGHFLDLRWPVRNEESMTVTLPPGPHCTDSRGRIETAALLVLYDAALASPLRRQLAPGVRVATVHLNAQFGAMPAPAAPAVLASVQSSMQAGAMPQLSGRGMLVDSAAPESQRRPWCAGSGSYVSLPPPKDARDMAPLPWQSEEPAPPSPLEPGQLDERERRVLATCDAALERADTEYSFLRCFWGILPERFNGGAACRLAPGPHLANRVGHVQGGILLGLAADTAQCAVPNHPHRANIAAWYISPGQGGELSCRSSVLHTGRSQAVVRTEITSSDGSRVLEALSAHSA